MCGRTACTLNARQLRHACAYAPQHGPPALVVPGWRHGTNPTDALSPDLSNTNAAGPCTSSMNRTYEPSFNVSPASICPVLIMDAVEPPRSSVPNSSMKNQTQPTRERVIQLMRWGLVPPWHKGDPGQMQYKMNNCRVETLLEKSTYSTPLKKGKRCVVVCDGFYEWQQTSNSPSKLSPMKSTGKVKQPHFFYFPQPVLFNWSEPESDGPGLIELGPESLEIPLQSDKSGVWAGRRLLTMAGLYDVNLNGETPLYSFCVITVPSSKAISWCHHRMPAILDGEEAICSWLEKPYNEAVKYLVPIDNLQSHPVSVLVNNSRNKSPDCIVPKPISSTKQEASPSLAKSEKRSMKSGVGAQKDSLFKYFKPVAKKRLLPDVAEGEKKMKQENLEVC